ncbi:MAG: ATP-binding cassette domain-containing protein, partial [Acidimicrobiales bacterium]|nr:ATP-binding cassette domain-containing protein [Acidimicrobiales bacterium]
WLPFDLRLDSNQIVVFLGAVVSALGLWYLMRRTTLGLRMRAVVDKPELADLRGVNEGRTSAAAWVVGSTIAVFAGVIGAPVLNTVLDYQFTYFMFVAAAAAVMAGLRSVPIAFIGGMVIGITQNLVVRYVEVDIQGFEQSVPFILLFLALVVIAVDRSRRGGSVSSDPPPVDYTDDLPQWRVALPYAIGVAVFVVLLFSPFDFFQLDGFWLGLAVTGLAYALVFQSFVIVTGLGGMVSLAQSAFVVLASMIVGRAMNEWGWPFLPALLLAVVVTMIVGAIVALPALRLGGLPLALATLSLSFMCDRVLFKWKWLGNDQIGWRIPQPELGPFNLADKRTQAVVLMVLLGVSFWLFHNLKRSPTGRSIIAVRNSEPAASTSGVSIPRVKLAVFALSAAIAGLGGVLLTLANGSASGGNISFQSFTTEKGLFWLAVVVLFGIRRPQGAIFAGLMVGMSSKVMQEGWHFWESPVEKTLFWGVVTAAVALTAYKALRERTPQAATYVGIGVLVWLGFIALMLGTDAWDHDSVPSLFHWNGTGAGSIGVIFANLLFGMGAVQLAREPDGVIAITGAQNRAKRDARRRARGEEVIDLAPHPEEMDADAHPVLDLTSATHDPAARIAADGDDHYVSTNPAALELDHLVTGYGLVEALHGVSLSVPRGEITAVLGPNGAGKSTTCLAAAGRLRPWSGAVRLGGEDVSLLPAWQRARRGIVLAPEARGIFPALTVAENLTLWLPTSDERDQAYDRFPILGERRGQTAGSLSGGEQQMLTLAPLLVKPPDVLIADEPSLGLAPLIVEQIMQLFVELRDRGVALLLVEEKARDVLEIADSVAFIGLGRVSWHGPRSAVDDDLLAAAYLGETVG